MSEYRMATVYLTRHITYSNSVQVAVPLSVPEDNVEDYIMENASELWDAVDESNAHDVDSDDAEVHSVEVGDEADEDDVDGADFTFDFEWEATD